MNPYIIFNGVSSFDFGPEGLIIEKLPDEIKPARNFEEVNILGRDGSAIDDLGTYKPYNTDVKINCNGASLTDVYAWLDGEGWLTTSDDPDFMRYIGIYDQIKDQRFRAGACYDSISIPIKVQPYKYKVTQEPIELSTADVFPGQGNRKAKPTLEITGTGDITLMVNGSSVLIDDLNGTIILDCDTETPYSEVNGVKTFQGRKITVIDNEWPELDTDLNSISWSGSVSKVIVHPWWRWI